ncbi:flagellin N-terminal helical domain-containing protein [Rhizobium sp.]
MTSIQTNAASTAALRVLRMTSSSLEDAQGQTATGLRVRDSSDNAAYWSISTTMRSDNVAVSAVVDALGLGGAVVDVAYTGLNAGIEVLDEIKSRLVAAREPGIDKGKIQKEIEQLKEQMGKIAQSSNFNGVNWLKTGLPQDLADVSTFKTDIVASFTRSSQNTVAVKTIELDQTQISMLNDGGGGMLQKDIRSLGTIGGFRNMNFTTSSHQGHQDQGFTGPRTFSATDTLSFDITIDQSDYSPGVTANVTIDKGVVDAALGSTTGYIGSGAAMRTVLEYAFRTNNIPATALSTWAGYDTSRFEIQSLEQSGNSGSSIAVSNVVSSFGSGLGLESSSHIIDHDNMYPSQTFSFDTAFTVHNTSEFSFDVKIGTGATDTVTVDRTLVDATLGTTDGVIGSAAELAAVLTAAGQSKGMVAIDDGNSIELTADHAVYPDAGSKAPQMTLGNVRDNIGLLLDFDLEDIDVTNPGITIDHYIEGVEEMLEKATNAATQLGAIQSRIENQQDFAKKIGQTIDKGIGRLVDADMNETSTRLKALQTQQQLGVQSLSIANTRADNILQLYR